MKIFLLLFALATVTTDLPCPWGLDGGPKVEDSNGN